VKHSKSAQKATLTKCVATRFVGLDSLVFLQLAGKPLCAFSFFWSQLVESETKFSASGLRHADDICSTELLTNEHKGELTIGWCSS